MSEIILRYFFRIFWAFILAAFLTMGFRASWNVERGNKTRMRPTRDDTVVWIDPIYFPVLFLIYMGMYLFIYVKTGKLELCMVSAVDLFLFLSIYYMFLLLFLPVLRRYFTARTCATFWLVPVFLYYQPQLLYSSITLPPVIYLYIPQKILMVLSGIWMVGFVLILGIQIASHLRFVLDLKKHSEKVDEPKILEVFEVIKTKLDYTLPVELRYCSKLGSPLSVGMRKKRKITYLPQKNFTNEELKMIFSHELHHIQRNDTHTKFFLRFCVALGWFHPLVWIAVKKGEEDLELSCDEIVLKDADDVCRNQYAHLLLSIAGDSRGFSTCLSSSAKSLRYRLKAAIQDKTKRLGTGLLFTVMFLSTIAAGRTGLAVERGTAADLIGADMSYIMKADLTFSKGKSLSISDTDKLLDYLLNIKLEKIAAVYIYTGSDTDDRISLSGELEEGKYFSLTEMNLEVYDWKDGSTANFHLLEPVDWKYIKSLE